MNRITRLARRSARALLWALAGAAAPAAAQPAKPPPAEDFVRTPEMSRVVISPSGEHVAMIVAGTNGRSALVTMPLRGGQPRAVASYSDVDVTQVNWVNDRRLVYEVMPPKHLVEWGGAGNVAVDLDGDNARDLIVWRSDNEVTGTRLRPQGLPYGWFLHQTLDDGSDDVLVRQMTTDRRGDRVVGRIARLDTRTGQLRTLTGDAPDFGYAWLTDKQGVLRVVAVARDGVHRIHWRPDADGPWQLVLEQDGRVADSWTPRFLQDDTTLVVEGRAPGRDAQALHALDLRSGRVDPEPLVAVAGFDLDAALETDLQRWDVVGLHTRATDQLSVWFDDRLAAIQKAVDAALPGRINRLGCGRCLSTRHFVVRSHSDRHPGEYFHYDHGDRSLRRLGRARPWIDERTQGRRSFHRVPARDGLPLPVYVTHPAGQAPADLAGGAKPSPLPTVLLIHGGPWVRGHSLAWSDEAQFLASRGWRVLEVEFRGSTGYGWRHFRAGWKQWGEAMQDDLADALAWATREGLADPERVCTYGHSYGGYAALMAPIRHPGRFRCAVSGFAVTDPMLRYTSWRSDLTVQGKRYVLPDLMGDPKADAALLAAASPVERVAELKGLPIFLAFGAEDRRVPREHADRFLGAARAAGVSVESQVYAEEGHGFSNPKNQIDFLQRAEVFLARALNR